MRDQFNWHPSRILAGPRKSAPIGRYGIVGGRPPARKRRNRAGSRPKPGRRGNPAKGSAGQPTPGSGGARRRSRGTQGFGIHATFAWYGSAWSDGVRQCQLRFQRAASGIYYPPETGRGQPPDELSLTRPGSAGASSAGASLALRRPCRSRAQRHWLSGRPCLVGLAVGPTGGALGLAGRLVGGGARPGGRGDFLAVGARDRRDGLAVGVALRRVNRLRHGRDIGSVPGGAVRVRGDCDRRHSPTRATAAANPGPSGSCKTPVARL